MTPDDNGGPYNPASEACVGRDPDLADLTADVNLSPDDPDRGGFAFPVDRLPVKAGAEYSSPGLTALDYFAAAALTGLLVTVEGSGQYRPERAAELAYDFARAMLRERQK